MSPRTLPALVLPLVIAFARPLAAQRSSSLPGSTVPRPRVDSASSPTTTGAPRLTTGMSFGSVSFVGGRTERATSASLRLHVTSWLSAAVAPSLVVASQPATGGAMVTQTGLADLPVELAVANSFTLPLSPSAGAAFTATLPVGDTASGLGARRVGWAGSAFLALAPTSWLSLQGGAGRSLTNFSIQGTLDGAASGWGYAGATVGLPVGFSLGADFDGDLGPVDQTLGRSTSVAVGLGVPAGRLGSLSLDVAHGLTGPTPTWGVALRVGIEYAGLATAGDRAPSEALAQTFGAGPHGLTTPPGNSGNTPAATNGHGHSGTTTGTTTHGRSGH